MSNPGSERSSAYLPLPVVFCAASIRATGLPLARVHDVSTALEIRMKQEDPKLFKVLIHPEPRTDNRR